MSEKKKVTLSRHVRETHSGKARVGAVITGDITGGDVVKKIEEPTNAKDKQARKEDA